MAKSLKDLDADLTKKKTGTGTTTRRRKTTPAKAETPEGGSEKISVANPTELAKQSTQNLELTEIPTPDFAGMVPSDPMSASSSINPISETQHEKALQQQAGQIRAVEVMGGNYDLIAAIEAAKIKAAKAAQTSIKKGAEVEKINQAIAQFDTAQEKRKAEEAKALQARIEREGIEALAPLVREMNEAKAAQARARIARVEATTAKLLQSDSSPAIDVPALEI